MARAKKGGQSRENKSSETAGRHLDEPQQTFSRSTAETALPLPCSVPLEIENGHIFSSRNAGRDDNTRAGFTLTDEARQTSLHDRSFWSSHTALRKNPVQFISTGQSNPLECKYTTEMSTDATNVRTTSQLEQHDQQGSFPQKKDQLETSHLLSKASCQGGIHNCTEDHTQLFGHETFKPVSSQFSGGGGSFRCDKIRWGTAHNINQPTSLLEHQFSPDTSSSDEVILFQGRKSRKEGKVITSYPSKRSVSPTSSAGSRYSGDDSYDLHMSPNLPTTRKQPKRKTYGTRKSTDDDILLDYINNMRDNGELDCVFDDEMSNQHDLGAKDDDFSFGSLSSVDEKPKASQASDYIKEENAKKYRKKNGSTSDTIKPSRLYDDDNGDSVGDLSDENALVTLIAAQHLSSVSATGVRKSPSSVSDNRPWTDNLGGEQFAFDFMDWNRPSVRRGRKSKRVQNQHMSFNNCDSDLERQLQMAWKSDRFRKKDRKQQREELRALEMLRKKTKPDDLRVKYPSGMTIEEVAEELRIFLQRNDEV
ncbi:squalene synthetase-like protein [Conoideocrella luteorostrata]|uniref:Squalene synthetase-like protein n=1 Tax=Conoideocrella luteorostrata TaxID=1105319 RepID=A0AAJ0D090_9HYPO|nr:squalene synthetase-like protein [Conoideocrella luteorostrata]